MTVDTFVKYVEGVLSTWPCVMIKGIKSDYDATTTVDRWDKCEELLPSILKIHQDFQAFGQDAKATVASYQLVLLLVEAAW